MKKKTVLIIILSVLGFVFLLAGGALLFESQIESLYLDTSLETDYAVIYKYEKDGNDLKLYMNNYSSGSPIYDIYTYPDIFVSSNVVLDSDLPTEVSIEIKNFRYHISKYDNTDEKFLSDLLSKIEEMQSSIETINSNEILYYKFALAEIYMKSEDTDVKESAKQLFEAIHTDAFTYSMNRPYACLIQKEILKSEITEEDAYSTLCDLPELKTTNIQPEDIEDIEFTLPDSETIEDLYLRYPMIIPDNDSLLTLTSTILLDSYLDGSDGIENIALIELANTKYTGLTKDNLAYWLQLNDLTDQGNSLKELLLNNTEDFNSLNSIYSTTLHQPMHIKYLDEIRFKDIAFVAYEY
jgi:hypothetical protein